MSIRILSIDGGGLRGLLPLWVLQEIESFTQKSIFESFDFFAGTSTGGIISCGLSVGEPGLQKKPLYSVADLIDLYENQGNTIFPLGNAVEEWWKDRDFSYLWNPVYSNDGLKSVLQKYFKDLKIRHCLKPIMVPTYCISSMEPIWFRSRIAYEDKELGISPAEADAHNLLLVDALMAATAAPTTLPAYSFSFGLEKKDQKPISRIGIDGGIYQNNPTASALVEFLRNQGPYNQRFNTRISGLEDFFVLSIGTGRYNQPLHERMGLMNGGKLDWARPAIDISMWGNAQAVDFQVNEWLQFGAGAGAKPHYLRINFDIEEEKSADMSNASPEVREELWRIFKKQFSHDPKIKSKTIDFLKLAGLMPGHQFS
jgi:patatin-like phospholipase/acyl hydrolase